MTAFCSHQDRLHELAAPGRSPIASSSRGYAGQLGARMRDAISRAMAAFGSGDDWSLEPATQGSCAPEGHAAKFPQRPLILGDKWDF